MSTPHANRIHVLGQGVAGSALAWCLYRAGLPFVVWDQGHEQAASRVGAGILNPITGQRLVPSWRWAEFLPLALALYRDVEYETGVRFLRPFRIQRRFADEREKRIFERKALTGEIGPALGARTADGFWIEGAWQADSALFIAAVRDYLHARGFLREEAAPFAPVDGELTIACTGRQWPQAWAGLPFQPWEGTILEFPCNELAPDVILNQGAWVLPWTATHARCGSTYWPPGTSAERRQEELSALAKAAESLVGRPIAVTRTFSGWRVATSDRRPVLGWSPDQPKLGLTLGLGAKGSLWAPFLASEWVAHLRHRKAFDGEVAIDRFLRAR